MEVKSSEPGFKECSYVEVAEESTQREYDQNPKGEKTLNKYIL